MFTRQELLWITQSLISQYKQLVRSRSKEIDGGEIYRLRTKELEFLNALQLKAEALKNATPEAEQHQQTKK